MLDPMELKPNWDDFYMYIEYRKMLDEQVELWM